MTEIAKDSPDPDELEVTLLGRGVGESCVVHLGGDRWLIVDSFKSGGQAAALSYLASIGVDYKRVEHVVVTHFHADHYRGIDQIIDSCSQAMLHITDALLADDFVKLFTPGLEPDFLGKMPEVIRQAAHRRVPSRNSAVPGLDGLHLGTSVFEAMPLS